MIDTNGLEKIAFCGNQTIVLIPACCETIHVYDVLKGVQLYEVLLPPHGHDLRTHWGHGDSLLFSTSYKTDGRITITTQELQPTSIPPFLATESFLLPSHDGAFSFSPVSFHASFLTTRKVIILDVRDLGTLLRIEETTGQHVEESGCFSPDGRFFAYMTSTDEIHVWKNMSTVYVPWSNFVPQFLGFRGFAFSPSAISILSWGNCGIELLDNHLRPPSPKNTRHRRTTGAHLVAYSADGTRIATARSHDGVVTVLDPLLDTPQRHINTNMQILEIKIFDNVLFVADKHELVSWDLGVGRTGRDAHGVKRMTLDGILWTGWCKLSKDCSQIAVVTERMVSLYDIKTREILNECMMGQGFLEGCWMEDIWNMRFSPDGSQLWFSLGSPWATGPHYCAMLHITEDWRSAEATGGLLEDGWSQDSRFPPPGYRIRLGAGWVEGPGGRRLLWLPPNWRTMHMAEAMWDGNFLALVDSRHPEPIIIEFRPEPLLPFNSFVESIVPHPNTFTPNHLV